jgi:hypothetical protein
MYVILSHNGRILNVTARTRPKDVISTFGNPTKSWNDGSERNLQYESRTQLIEFSFKLGFFRRSEGKLTYVNIEEPAPKKSA